MFEPDGFKETNQQAKLINLNISLNTYKVVILYLSQCHLQMHKSICE